MGPPIVRPPRLPPPRRNTKPKDVLVAEGDSWFSYPGSNILKLVKTNILEELEKKYEVKEVASTGDTLEEMAYSEQQIDKLIECLRKEENPPKAILFSGGGNDFASALETILDHKKSKFPAWNEKLFNEALNKKYGNYILDEGKIFQVLGPAIYFGYYGRGFFRVQTPLM